VSDGGEALRPVIVQDVDSGAVLMLAWANAAATRTLGSTRSKRHGVRAI